ncbi:rna polymerase sigma factor region 3/4 [Lucifera butyrica]|uniref:UPF0122 protein LUCI_0859 n=1 Tax=Lucifera butyrica TaxID=1351585 RepID=A0A498R397_9FIRM|nr:YlxM family DNA-binding protein [Lucifera butyrica]VBB05649.1 rna polymerase sigma factor region 3/4 [Lucifera butyrica]
MLTSIFTCQHFKLLILSQVTVVLDKVLRVGLLYDYYGALLTEKQQQCLEMHYLHDLSLSEIAAEFSVSRQAVHDIIRRAEQILEEHESKLKLVQRHQQDQQVMKKVHELLCSLPDEMRQRPEIQESIHQIGLLLNFPKEL